MPVFLPHRRLGARLVVVIGIGCVGVIDFVTGSDIHVNAFYFVPLAYAGARLGRRGAVAASLLAAATWSVSFYAERQHDNPLYIYVTNFVLQGIAFGVVAFLVAQLSQLLASQTDSSRRDGLTGLANRSAFFERAGLALERCRRNALPVAVAFIDLDGFKNVNDAYGHARGDLVLRACAMAIEASRRSGDVAARLGGDEFVVLLPGADADEAERLLEHMRERLDRDAEFVAVRVTASVGVVVDLVAASRLDVLIARADEQMYAVKRSPPPRRCRAHVIGGSDEARPRESAIASSSFAGIRQGGRDRPAD